MKTNGSETPNGSRRHGWKFFRAGGFDQVNLASGADIAALADLDQKLWVALACPTRGLEFDTKTLDLIDTDKDGRIRAPEVLAAVHWACANVKDPEVFLKGSPALALSAINDATPEGKQLLTSARQILANLGKPEAAEISVEDTIDTARIFAQTHFNGDGIVPAEAAPDPVDQALITDIIACLGAETDRSGKPGINQAKVDKFFAEIQAHDEWWKKAEVDSTLLPAGERTAEAAAAVQAVKAKVDDYFARGRLAAFDTRAAAALNREEKDYQALAPKELSLATAEILALPLARVEPGRPLPLQAGANPAWAGALARLQQAAVAPLLGERAELTEADWETLQARLAPYGAWQAAKAGPAVEKLGRARVRAIATGPGQQSLTALVARDLALEAESNAIAAVDKLVRLNRDLYRLLVNYVNFSDFYRRNSKAIFQAGTLYLDQRSCHLCLTVEDAGKHAAMAGLAGTYLAYCDCLRRGTGEKLSIVAAFTDGDSDNLMVGRNGVFYDRKGRDYDATITKIVDNPISIRQAFWAPYKKLVRMIEEQVAKRAAEADAAATAQLEAVATTAASVGKAGAKPSEPRKIDVGAVAALGVAFGAIGTALSALATGLLKLEIWQIPLVFGALSLIISSPSMLIAWLKLRKRNLGPILDANGWAVNAKARVNVPFGTSLTEVAKLPPGAQRDVTDPFAEKKSPWPSIIVLVVLLWCTYAVLNNFGYIDEWLAPLKAKGPAAAAATPKTNPTNPTNAPPAAPK